MKTKRFFFGLPVVLLAVSASLALGLVLTGCGGDDGDGGGGDDSNNGWLTFSDEYPPQGGLDRDVYVTAEQSIASATDLENAATVAYSSNSSVLSGAWEDEPNKKMQLHVAAEGATVSGRHPVWTETGTYTVVVKIFANLKYGYYIKTGVSFTNGSATVAWGDFTLLE